MLPTHDPEAFLAAETVEYMEFFCPIDGEHWRIYGECSRCGACYESGPMPLPGVEHVVRPEIADLDGCTLTGEYL